MSKAVNLPTQREAIYQTLIGLQIGAVEKYNRKDPVPPVTMVTDPRIDFPDNSYVGRVEWSIWMLGSRKSPDAIGENLDVAMPKVLAALSNGINIGFVLQRVENVVRTIEGYPLPGYTIYGTCSLPNC
jgi:hypothetical protein